MDCSTSSESIDALVAEGEKVVDKQHMQESESEEVADKQQVDDENKTEFDEDYANELNQNVFVLEVTLNKLTEIAPFVANKLIFKDKLLSCKRMLDTLLPSFDPVGQCSLPMNFLSFSFPLINRLIGHIECSTSNAPLLRFPDSRFERQEPGCDNEQCEFGWNGRPHPERTQAKEADPQQRVLFEEELREGDQQTIRCTEERAGRR